VALTRSTSQIEEVSLALPAAAAYEIVLAAFGEVGKVQASELVFRRVSGRIFSGTGRMNPANVTVSVEAEGATDSKLRIASTAQEGLIPQNTAARAVSRLLASIANHATKS